MTPPDGCRGRENRYFLRVLYIDHAGVNGPSHKYILDTNWTGWSIYTEGAGRREEAMGKRMALGGVRGDYVKIHCMNLKLSKNKNTF